MTMPFRSSYKSDTLDDALNAMTTDAQPEAMNELAADALEFHRWADGVLRTDLAATGPAAGTWNRVLRDTAQETSEGPREMSTATSGLPTQGNAGSSSESFRERTSRFTNLAATIALVLAVAVGGWLAMSQMPGGGGRFAAFQATPYASQGVAKLPPQVSSTPAADVLLDAEPIPGLRSVGGYHIVGSTFIGVMPGGGPDRVQLVSYDLETRAIRWQQEESTWMHFVFSDDVSVGISYNDLPGAEVNALPEFDEMVAFDNRTGEKLWTKSISEWRKVHGWETIVMVGKQVVFLQGGEVIAIDARTGEAGWQAPYELYTASEENDIHMPALAHSDNHLYLAQVNGVVEVLDLATGESIDQFNLPATFTDAHPVGVQLYPVPAGLLVTANTYAGSGALTTLMVVNPDNGEVVWERSLERSLDQPGLVEVSPDGSIAIATHTWESAPLLLRLIGQDGHSTYALIWLDATGEVVLETEPVRMPEGPLALAVSEDYACVIADEFVCFDRADTKYIPRTMAMWGVEFVGDMLIVFTDTGMMRVDFP